MDIKDQNKFILTYPDYKNFKGILSNSYKQMKEFINPLYFFLPTKEKIGQFNKKLFLNSLFGGKIVNLPRFNIADPNIEKYERFEEFTKRDEVNNISLWILSAFKYLSLSSTVLLGKELEIAQFDNPRDGRLDVVALMNNTAMVIETKTDLRSALVENRFLYQVLNYKKECVKLINQYRQNGLAIVILGIGGEETDLFPPNHPDCTSGKVGNISKIFYDKISEKNIQFISANALWSLVTYKFIRNKKIDLLKFLFSVFSDKNTIGLLSGGIVIKKKGKLTVKSIDLEKF